uniref:Uncharacterized protein n=1 Tax=Trichobilharzia regenti TaxID=157069 RepID=A0AA85J6Y6_TRIRE|nr:unnamed protein product [Trichobilharzia regenti]
MILTDWSWDFVFFRYLLVFMALFAVYILPLLKVFFNYTIGKILFSKRKQLKRAGEWAIVTGATDGIGKAYAEQLAKDGLNIMLISRNLEKLSKVAKEIESSYGVKTRVVVADFTKNNIYESIEKEIASLSSIACLVNNVGMSYPHFDDYARAKFMNCNFIQDMITCNTHSIAVMTYLVLSRLLKQKSGTSSAIINIASYAGTVTTPFGSLYGATKAFIYHFSQSIAAELRLSSSSSSKTTKSGQNVIIQTVCPLFVVTAMSRVERPSLFIPTPSDYVNSALNMLGVEELTMGYFTHALQGYFFNIIPLSWKHDKCKKMVEKGRKKFE